MRIALRKKVLALLRWWAGPVSRVEEPLAPRFTRRGVILVLVLWTVVVLTVLAATLAFDVQVNARLARLQREQFLAYNLARSAIAAGMNDLLNDSIVDFVDDPNRPYDGYGDAWAQPGVRPEDRRIPFGPDGPEKRRSSRTIRFSTPTFEYQVRDEEGKIPLNSASPQLLQAMFEVFGMEEEDAQLVAAAISDFRDADDVASARDAAGMKENEYWSSQVGQDVGSLSFTGEFAVRMPNEPFHSLDQLMDIPGVPAHIFYGFDPSDEEAAAAYQNRAGDLDGGRPRGMSGSRRNSGSGLRPGRRDEITPLRDILTVRTFGTAAAARVNINTAPEEVVAILMYAASPGGGLQQARNSANAVARYRGDDRPGGSMKREDAIKSVEDLGKISGSGLEALSSLVNNAGTIGLQVGFRSENFEITGIGRIGNSEKIVTCWVNRSLDVFNPDDPRLIPVKEARRSIFGAGAGGFGAAKSISSDENRAVAPGGTTDNFIRIPAIRVTGWYE